MTTASGPFSSATGTANPSLPVGAAANTTIVRRNGVGGRLRPSDGRHACIRPTFFSRDHPTVRWLPAAAQRPELPGRLRGDLRLDLGRANGAQPGVIEPRNQAALAGGRSRRCVLPDAE